MTSVAHTPGPWSYDQHSGAICHAEGGLQPLVASTNFECVLIEQGDADGRLIAAAPELLAAAKELSAALAMCTPNSRYGADCQHKALMLARSAIAKATDEGRRP